MMFVHMICLVTFFFFLNVVTQHCNKFVFLTTFRSSSSRERGGDRADRDRDRFERFDRGEGREGRDGRGSQNQISKRSFSRESQEHGGRGGDSRATNEPVRRVASMTDDRDRGSRDRGSRDRGSRDRGSRDRGSRDRGPSKDLTGELQDKLMVSGVHTDIRTRDVRGILFNWYRLLFFSVVKRESAPTPPPPSSLPKPALTEEEVEKKSNAIIEEYLHINDLKVQT